jgi:hypothetical protein
LILLLLAAAPTVEELRDRFLDRNLVALIEARGRDEDARFDLGRAGLLDDLTRLVRCRTIGPIPVEEDPELTAIRTLVRLERVRLEQLARDGLHTATSLAKLLDPSTYPTDATLPSTVVVWPVEAERWPNERRLERPRPSICPKRAGQRRERGADADARRARRAEAVTALLAEAVDLGAALPEEMRGRVALAYLGDATAPIPLERLPRLEAAVSVAAPPERTAARILLGKELERAVEISRAKAQHAAVLADPTRTPAEDSRARVRLAFLEEASEESDPVAILALVRAGVPRPGADALALAAAEARALLALGRAEELLSFGRRWLQDPRADTPVEIQVEHILFSAALMLEPPQAMAWIQEISNARRDPRGLSRDLARLAELAASEKRHDLAVAVYDRLRIEAKRDRARLGPRAAQIEARWLRERAAVEYERRDVPAFAGFVDEMLALAREEKDRPLARLAPHRAVARLCQDLVPRLTQDVAADEARRPFAALLLQAVAELGAGEGRAARILASHRGPLEALSGSIAGARIDRARPARKVRQLGEVVVPRLPPPIEPVDVPTPIPAADSFLVFEDRDGRWRCGAPWLLGAVGVD